MIPYLGCETAREMLEAFADGELPVADQVAVQSHLRWCRTCSAYIEDVCLIGSGMRSGSLAVVPDEDDSEALAAIQSGVLTRVRAEHDQSFRIQAAELFEDMRLLWPALGATTAVLICLLGAFGVLRFAAREHPDSLAAMIESLSEPGSDRNPVRLDPAFSLPRSLDDYAGLDAMQSDDALYAVATVVTREGRVAGYELLDPHRMSSDVEALLHTVKQSRFEPAQAPGGRTIAVNMVWLFAWTTVERDVHLEELLKGSARPVRTMRAETPVPAVAPPVPAADPTQPEAELPSGQRSSTIDTSTTA